VDAHQQPVLGPLVVDRVEGGDEVEGCWCCRVVEVGEVPDLEAHVLQTLTAARARAYVTAHSLRS